MHIYAGIYMSTTHHEKRREILRQLLTKGNSQTQEMLVLALNELGYKSIQSSVSRDLKGLGAIKTICLNSTAQLNDKTTDKDEHEMS